MDATALHLYIQNMPPPLMDEGRPSEFLVRFPTYLTTLDAEVALEESSKFMLLTKALKKCPSALAELEAAQERAQREGGRVSFSQFWKTLERTYGQDTRAATLAEMKALRPEKGTGGGPMSVNQWLKYTSEFRKLLARLPDVTEEEVKDWVLPHVPQRMKLTLSRQEQVKDLKKPSVRVGGLNPSVTVRVLEASLMDATDSVRQGEGFKITRQGNGFLVRCPSSQVRDAVLDLNGEPMGGTR
jgi:hypothetical protein